MSVKATMRRTWPVLLSYAIFSMWGICCFTASLVLTSGGLGLEPGAWGVLGGVLAAVAVGHLLGNILGLSGFRLVPISIIFFSAFMIVSLSGVALGIIAVFLIIAVIAAYGGYLGIASRLDVVASWYPLTFCVGGAIHWMNAHRAIETFNSGAKYALWDAFTIVCLAGGVFWMLVFLATRNSLGLTVWQEVARPKAADATDDSVTVARPGRGSILVLMAFTIVALGTTALVSPYLFRTAHHDGKDGQSQQEADGKPQKGDGQGEGDGSGYKGKKSKGKGKSTAKNGDGTSKSKGGHQQRRRGRGQRGNGEKGDGQQGDQGDDGADDPDTEGAGEAAMEAASLAIKILAGILIAALILLFLYLAVLPPIRRAFLMKHLEKPLWPVAPTSRVMNHWRRALAVLAVAGIEPSAGETASDFARRATAEVKEQLHCDAPGLGDAAAIVEKIAYAGRGLGQADEQAVKEATTRFIDTVRPNIKLRSRFAASWSKTPEVES
ncbi:MAG: DUF4129 domain-containing protein [Labilithrix sp.]